MVGAVAAILVIIVVAGTIGVGKNKGKDYVWADGTKVFGERTLKDGTTKRGRVEYPNGEIDFDVTIQSDGTTKVGRSELRDGEKRFDVTVLSDGTAKVGRSELPYGIKGFDLTIFPDRTIKIGREELPNGEKYFDVTQLPDGTRSVGRATKPDGTDVPSRVEHLSFRGLHAGQSREDVEAILKKWDESAYCEPSPEDGGEYECSKGKDGPALLSNGIRVDSLSFSQDGKLHKYILYLMNPPNVGNPDDFYPALRSELAVANHKEGTLEPSFLEGNQTFTWVTDQTFVCFKRDDCPTERIRLLQSPNPYLSATIEFSDNVFYSEGRCLLYC